MTPASVGARPEVVESSLATVPDWVHSSSSHAAHRLVFVGGGVAPTMEAARADATRDLLASISQFISVDVRSSSYDFQDQEGHVTADLVEVKSRAKLTGFAVDRFYWERVVASPFAPANHHFHFFARAEIDRGQMQMVRSAAQAQREAALKKRTLLILPHEGFDVVFQEAARKDTALYVTDIEEVARVLRAVGGESVPLETLIRDAQDWFAPDLILYVAPSRAKHGSLVVTMVDGRTGASLGSEELGRPARGHPYHSAIARAIQDAPRALARLQARREVEMKRPTDSAIRAAEVRHRGLLAYRKGANEDALKELAEAIALEPYNSRSYMLAGRVLERIGHYGRLPPSEAVAEAARGVNMLACTNAGRAAIARAREALLLRASHASSNNTGQEAGAITQPIAHSFVSIPEVLNAARIRLTELEPKSTIAEASVDFGRYRTSMELSGPSLAHTLNAASTSALSDWQPPIVVGCARSVENDDSDQAIAGPQVPRLSTQTEIKASPPPVTPRMRESTLPEAYDRILGAEALAPDEFVYLSPALLEVSFDRASAKRALDTLNVVWTNADLVGRRRHASVARLNAGGLAWFLGMADIAYAHVHVAQDELAAQGDVQGLAHAHEWIGFFMRQSDAPERASEELARARSIFLSLGDVVGAERILTYAR